MDANDPAEDNAAIAEDSNIPETLVRQKTYIEHNFLSDNQFRNVGPWIQAIALHMANPDKFHLKSPHATLQPDLTTGKKVDVNAWVREVAPGLCNEDGSIANKSEDLRYEELRTLPDFADRLFNHQDVHGRQLFLHQPPVNRASELQYAFDIDALSFVCSDIPLRKPLHGIVSVSILLSLATLFS